MTDGSPSRGSSVRATTEACTKVGFCKSQRYLHKWQEELEIEHGHQVEGDRQCVSATAGCFPSLVYLGHQPHLLGRFSGLRPQMLTAMGLLQPQPCTLVHTGPSELRSWPPVSNHCSPSTPLPHSHWEGLLNPSWSGFSPRAWSTSLFIRNLLVPDPCSSHLPCGYLVEVEGRRACHEPPLGLLVLVPIALLGESTLMLSTFLRFGPLSS